MSIEALKKAREALDSIRQYGSDTLSGPVGNVANDRAWMREGVLEMTNRASRALAAIDAEAKPVVRMLTEAEFAECCGGCKVTSAAMTWMRRSVDKAAEVWGLTIGEQG